MASEKQSTEREQALELRRSMQDKVAPGSYAFRLKVTRLTHVDAVIFESQAEVCEAIEVLCRALQDGIQGKPWSANYQSEPALMEVQAVRCI